MEFLFGVSDFGKIKHAEITLSNFTLFVGDNNSGKTFMMQLWREKYWGLQILEIW